ncbi:MAG: phenylalanine--tRNA ligase subunit beta [Alphaproteobacteria bacterium]|nr:phenylalanine--tRNA ligase subunit beta [Alphaproteobacteria bacterium]
MKFTLSWLKDHLETTASISEIAQKLTAIGLEVEQIIDRSESLKSFTVAQIIAAEKHPQADKLRVCKVASDAGELQIVCGAPNARAGIYVALAKEGALIPRDGFVIKKTSIRGVESNGMLCSADELQLGGDSQGIIELPESNIGTPIAEVLGLSDPVIDIAITPNRADCLGVRGIARDLAAAGLGTLKPLAPISSVEASSESPIGITIETASCQQFIGITIRGVKNAPSPKWLAQRLEAIGQKPISALVDITNYFTFDLGRPLHVYDADKLKGPLTVRGASAGEPLHALNDKHYELESGMCVIADSSGAVALGGIIGGMATGCDLSTQNVLLEVALFDPAHVAASGRALQIESDARYRFERGLDVAFLEEGARRAAAMIQSLCGGVASQPVMAGKTPDWQRTIAFTPERVKTLGGVDISAETSYGVLEKLGFTVIRHPSSVVPPSWRADVEGEADLVEEILRIHGYDHIPASPLPAAGFNTSAARTPAQLRVLAARRAAVVLGYDETCHYSFISEKQAKDFGDQKPQLVLQNPISADLSVMRPSLLPGLLASARSNISRGQSDLALAELGLTFHDVGEKGQQMVLGALRTGRSKHYVYGAQFQEKRELLSAYDAKREALFVLSQLGVMKADITTSAPVWYHPGRSGALTLGGKIILGYFGELHPGLLSAHDINEPAVAFEIFLGAIFEPRAKGKMKPALKRSDFPAVERDFAFIVDQKLPAADIEKTIRAADKQLITEVQLFDVYSGKGVDSGKKSVAIRVTLQSFERTLTEEDIAAASRQILQAAGKFGGVLRQ